MNEKEYKDQVDKALLHAEEVKQRQEIHELKHKNDKPKEKLSFSKGVFIFMTSNCVVIEIYSLVAMYILKDLSALPALIAAVVGECITICGYFIKSGMENTKDGIVFETAMKKLEYELENDDAVG